TARLVRLRPQSAEDIRRAKSAVVGASKPMDEARLELRGFLFKHMYRHPRALEVWDRARAAISCLFPTFMEDPALLPPEWTKLSAGAPERRRARIVADYIAGMTDRYALQEHRRLSERAT
ncbi:MAG TPA: deoxyguanosinetriphosphate triphosphohydrolase, partial [Methylocystis sp.]|nr:deoxyguanosinetriphosphate triphosphohydrolase [Methylocystis sp.]